MKTLLLTLVLGTITLVAFPQKKVYEKYLKSGKTKFEAQDYSGALVDFTMAIEARPREPEAYYQRGLTYYWLYNNEKAIENYTLAIQADDKFEQAYFERGYLHLTDKRYEQALVDFQKSVSLNSKDKTSLYNLGLSKYHLGDYVGAIAEYTRTIEVDPTYASAYYNRALAKYYLGDYTGAISDSNLLLEIDPNHVNGYYNRGLSKYSLYDYEMAIEDYDKAIELDPSYTNAYYNRGLCKYYLAWYEEAIKDFDLAIERDPTYVNGIYNRGLAKYNLQNYTGAVEDFNRVIQLSPSDYEAYYRRGLAQYYLKDYGASARDYQAALDINPQYENAQMELKLVSPYLEGTNTEKTPKTTKRMPQIWAVVVGISDYADQDMNLAYADKDAKAVYEFLRSPAGGALDVDHATLLVNENATRANIIKALTEKFYRAFETDMVMLFIASHGQPDPVGNEVYFLSHDTDKNNVGGTGVSQIDIEKIFSRTRAKKKIWIADACHSGGAGLSMSGMRGEEQSAMINKLLFSMALASDGMAMFTASSSSEFSYEDQRWGGGHGVFTYHLLEGLKGGADQNQNEIVELRELYEYVYRGVSGDTGGKQHPELKGNFDNALPLSVVRY